MFRGDKLTSFLLWQRCSVVSAFSDFWNFVMVAFIEWYIFVLVFSDGPILKVTGEFEEKKTYDSMYSPVLNICQLSNSSLSVQDLVSANCKVFSYKILQGHWWTTFLFRNKSIIFEITAKSIVIKVWCILNIQHDYIYLHNPPLSWFCYKLGQNLSMFLMCVCCFFSVSERLISCGHFSGFEFLSDQLFAIIGFTDVSAKRRSV